VIVPAQESPAGLRRVVALGEAFLGHLERRVFPGGCFFATVSVQLAARPGRARDRVMDLQRVWQGQFVEAVREAVAAGELPTDVDVEQLVFEVTAMLLRANLTWILTSDAAGLARARTGIRNVLNRAAVTGGRRKPAVKRARGR